MYSPDLENFLRIALSLFAHPSIAISSEIISAWSQLLERCPHVLGRGEGRPREPVGVPPGQLDGRPLLPGQAGVEDAESQAVPRRQLQDLVRDPAALDEGQEGGGHALRGGRRGPAGAARAAR